MPGLLSTSAYIFIMHTLHEPSAQEAAYVLNSRAVVTKGCQRSVDLLSLPSCICLQHHTASRQLPTGPAVTS